MINKTLIILYLIIIVVAVLLSLLFHIPYIYTLIGFSAWAFGGHLVTIDDDLPGGWSNPDGKAPFPKKELMIKFLILLALLGTLILFPQIKFFGS